MDALNGRLWGLPPFNSYNSNNRKRRRGKSSDSDSAETSGRRFPLKQAVTAASLALAGDSIAQLHQRWLKINNNNNNNNNKGNALEEEEHQGDDASTSKDIMGNLLSDHDWLRSLRMTSYGFLLYGPGSYAWYQYLDHCMPKKNIQNLLLKVLLNQVVLGPTVIGVVFAWNNLWLGKLSELPNKYQNDALPTLLSGFRFWIPVSLLNFWYYEFEQERYPLWYLQVLVVPLQARVAFMSTGSIFWNFCLSSTMSK